MKLTLTSLLIGLTAAFAEPDAVVCYEVCYEIGGYYGGKGGKKGGYYGGKKGGKGGKGGYYGFFYEECETICEHGPSRRKLDAYYGGGYYD